MKRIVTIFTLLLVMMNLSCQQQKQEASDLMIKSLLMAFFALLLRNGITQAEHSVPEKNELRLYSVIEPALRCIKNEYRRELTVEELAKKCNVSKHYFCRVFKAVTRKSAMEYLRSFRLQVANILLSNTKSSISEIAACCGFESANYFSRCYKQYYGVSASSCRAGKGDHI